MLDSVAVAKLVAPYFDHFEWNGITLTVDPNDIHKIDQWWRVSVLPSRWPERLFPVLEERAIVEERPGDEHNLRVLFSLGEPVEEMDLAVAA